MTRAVKYHQHRVRVRREDAAFLYALLESYEGIAAYSTLDAGPATRYCDLRLQVPPDFESVVDALLHQLRHWVFRI